MRLGLIGFGNISQTLLAQLADADFAPLEQVCVLCRPDSVGAARRTLAAGHSGTAHTLDVVGDVDALLAARPQLVVECAGHGAVTAHVPAVLRAGVDVVVVSVGALADAELDAALRDAAAEGGSRVILPAGAVGGVDILAALSAAGGLDVSYRGIKPPRAWAGTPAAAQVDLDTLDRAATFFRGDARQAARDYPKNANVAATLALAGAGFEATRVELVADPAAPGNVHEYSVTSPLASYSIRIENKASAGNAKTSVATVFSVLREIRNRVGPVAI
jgi:aspartate dehydrogenase